MYGDVDWKKGWESGGTVLGLLTSLNCRVCLIQNSVVNKFLADRT